MKTNANQTSLYRKLLIDRLEREPEIRILLIESVCTDQMVSIMFHNLSSAKEKRTIINTKSYDTDART